MLLLGLALAAAPAEGQQAPLKVNLQENVPNPVTTGTTIGFRIDPEVCGGGHVPTVSLQIYNVLVQVVAVPVLEDGRPLTNLRLACGEHRAVWDGRQRDGRLAQTGVYYYQLVVDGQRFTHKLIVQRNSSGAT
jgi:hypothetical protein